MTTTFTRISSYRGNRTTQRAIEVRNDSGKLLLISLRRRFETIEAWVIRAVAEARA